MSKSVRLVPGVYFIFADISFDIPYEEMLKKTLSALHPQERPWLEFRNENEHDLHIHVSSHSRFLLGSCSNVGGVPRNTVDLNRLPNIPAKHHFICESQSDAASRGLVNMVTDMGQLLQIQEAKMVQMQTAMESVAKQMEENYKL